MVLVLVDFFVNMGMIKLPPERCQEVSVRKISDKIQRLMELDDRPLTESRSFGKRLLGNCRDLSLMLCAALRNHGIPARVRSGFATFFDPKSYLIIGYVSIGQVMNSDGSE